MEKKLFYILIFFCIYVKAQSIKEQVIENVSKIESIDINSSKFSDLKAIGNAVGESKIVFLGEQDHGDATTFEAKSRIIKYLHEKKGFDVLAFESDFFSINKKSDENKSIKSIEESIFPIWSNCVQVNPLFEYIQKQQKSNPIIISGFDCQIAQNYKDDTDRKIYIKTITEYIKENVNISEIEDYMLFEKTLENLIFFIKAKNNTKAYFKKIGNSTQKKFFKTLSSIMDIIKNKETFLFKSLENSFFYARMAWKKNGFRQDRDTQMGKNILWLHKIKFPNKKIIVWAHSGHLVNKIYNKKGKRIYYHRGISKNTAGGYVINKLNRRDVFNLGFISRIGETKRVSLNIKSHKYKLELPVKESIENWIFSKKFKYAFIDFLTLTNNSEVFEMKGIYHNSYKANWLKAFDGVFFIDEMFPCKREK